MRYCMECGTRLVYRELEGEGEVPFCCKCNKFCFPMYNVAVSIICVDAESRKILLIKQYSRPDYILVAGYVNKGESAEHAVVRELMEETGLKAEKVIYNKSQYFEPSNTLMLNFTCVIDKNSKLKLNNEVDYAQWFDFDDARVNIKRGSLAQKFLLGYLEGNISERGGVFEM